MTAVDDWALSPEPALVGIALHTGAVTGDVDVQPGDFADPRLGAIWATITRLHQAGQPTDPITVVAQPFDGIRGVDAVLLHTLHADAPLALEADHYARLVIEQAQRRRLSATAVRIQQLVHEQAPAADAIEIARAEIDACNRATAETNYIADHLDHVIESLDTEPEFTPTPWVDLNHLIHGWMPGALYTIGARPGVGKSLISTQAAVELAKTGHVAMNNLEMSKTEIIKRIYAQTAQIKLDRLLFNKLEAADWQKVEQHKPAIRALQLSIDDRTDVRPVDIKAHARTISRRGHLAGVVVDYVQLMNAAPGDKRPRHEVVGEFSRQLKVLAKELHVPVIMLAQLNRDAANRPPGLADLRESGSLEQDSDVVILLHVNEDDPTEMHLNVAKNRHGQTGDLTLLRRGHYARVDSAAWEPR
ncbi:AAA family ATPase [Cellulosimicrobium cellulans]|uniref:replicative DNA helicase n=1 Tax=Cellulosimicrobium cellulans TaxID=1710 RepID=UPI00196690FD|nr:DnaB-like helicase C-terminal domain-containing protein [Cellulosimicrobium cellulans]MBN0040200.1 AAA family ATPase [Cellulosimicrobium cellulans]